MKPDTHMKVAIIGVAALGDMIAYHTITDTKYSVIGLGSTIVDTIRIGEGSIIGAGAVVVKDTERKSVSIGVPAK